MKHSLVFFLLFSICLHISIAQDTIQKEGWNFGLLPGLAFNSDLGLFYGGILNAFEYGDGSLYPNYNQKIYVQLSAYTRGSQDHIFKYESFDLLSSARIKAVMRYTDNQASQFYGFNGYESIYNRDYEEPESGIYLSRVFYRFAKRVAILTVDIQDTIGVSSFRWRAGIDIRKYKCGPVDIDKLNSKMKDGESALPNITGLYERYVSYGIINQDEKDGGWANSLNFGLVYDTREKLSNPQSGVYSEFNFRWTPSLLGASEYSNTRISLIHRQYFPVIKNRLSFAYRFIIDYTLSGQPAFYARPLVPAYEAFEGFGGSKSLRGVSRNRLVGESMVMSNFELRSRIVNFTLINQNWYMGVNVFMDTGKFLKRIKVNREGIFEIDQELFFGSIDNEFHSSYGLAVKLVMNENFVLSAEYARTIDIRDGVDGIYLNLNYLF